MTDKNAYVKSILVGREARGILTVSMSLDYGSLRQSFGNYCLYTNPDKEKKVQRGFSCCGHFIWRLLDICGVEELGDAVGKTIRVRGSDSKIEAIGHIVNDDWFYPEAEFKSGELTND